jgi:hypothetical protein
MARRCRRRGHDCNSLHRGEIAYWLVHRQQRRCIDLRGRWRAHRVAAMGLLYKSDLPVRRRTGTSVCQPPRAPTSMSKGGKAASACSGVTPKLNSISHRQNNLAREPFCAPVETHLTLQLAANMLSITRVLPKRGRSDHSANSTRQARRTF